MKTRTSIVGTNRSRSRFARLLAVLPLLALPVAVQAQYAYTTNSGALSIAAYTGSGGWATIPGAAYGLLITSIGASAFAQSSSLTNVTIPAGVTAIGSLAFANCTNLAGLYFQGNAPTLGDSSVFYGDSATVYYVSGAANWSPLFGGLPTVLLNPQWLQVTISPATAITAGAKWQVDGGAWQNSGAIVTNLAVGSHIISFNTLAGWTPPSSKTVTLTTVNGTAASGSYTFVGSYGLVKNGGFETGDFSGWTLVATPQDAFADDGSQTGITPESGRYEAALGQVGSLGYLSQTLATTPGANYMLSFWVECNGQTPNDFLVSWNGKTLLNDANLPAIGWTNVQFLVNATATSTVLEFGFQDDNNYLALDNVSVLPVPTDAGLLQVTILPAGAVMSGAQWQVDGGSPQPASATTLVLPAGNHTLAFGTLTGWSAPTNQMVVINSGATTAASAAYTFLADYGLVSDGGFQNGGFSGWTFSGDTQDSFIDDGSLTGIAPQSGRYEAVLGQIGSLGYLSQTVATTPGANYLLSFWVESDGQTPNEFLASWNGKALLDDVNLPAVAWTNFQFLVNATGANTVLQFGFRDDNSYLGLDDVSLLPAPTPVTLGAAGVQANEFGFSATGPSGLVVVVEANTNLANPTWYPVQTNTLSTGSSSFRDPQWTNAPARFYRLKCQ
ncbi:MAG: leucine-rich repeat protein [Limisphaerales bacterium]